MTQSKAWQFRETGSPEVLDLVDHDLPTPAPGEALVRLEAIGVNRGDLSYLAGRYLTEPTVPSFLGQEGAGTVVELGPTQENNHPPAGFQPSVGTRVALAVGRVNYSRMGTYRNYGIYPHNALLPIPEGYSAAEGAALWIGALTAWGCFDVAGLNTINGPGKTVLITAASSGVGTLALVMARALGAKTIAVTTSPEKVTDLGRLADHVIWAHRPEDMLEPIRQYTDGKGFDVGVDPVGSAYLPAFYHVAGLGAQIVFIGRMSGDQAPADLRTIIGKELSLHGFTVYRMQRNPVLLDRAVVDIVALAANPETALHMRPTIDRTFAFEDAPRALEALSRNEHIGKIVIRVE